MNCLVLGRSGQVASHLAQLMPGATFWGRDRLDLNQIEVIRAAIVAAAPSHIVNAAAYTAVDRAESEPEQAWNINAAAVAEAAKAANDLDVPLIHISTDYVFDGTSNRPYTVDDPVRPVSTYGRTKLAGEIAIETLCSKYWILRTSWVFSEFGANFVKTMIRLAGERDSLNVVADQRGIPTYAGDLARVISAIVSASSAEPVPWGTLHAVGGIEASWFEFAEIIFAQSFSRQLIDRKIDVHAISTEAYPTPAHRPANSVLEPSTELLRPLGIQMDWEKGLETMLDALITSA